MLFLIGLSSQIIYGEGGIYDLGYTVASHQGNEMFWLLASLFRTLLPAKFQ